MVQTYNSTNVANLCLCLGFILSHSFSGQFSRRFQGPHSPWDGHEGDAHFCLVCRYGPYSVPLLVVNVRTLSQGGHERLRAVISGRFTLWDRPSTGRGSVLPEKWWDAENHRELKSSHTMCYRRVTSLMFLPQRTSVRRRSTRSPAFWWCS